MNYRVDNPLVIHLEQPVGRGMTPSITLEIFIQQLIEELFNMDELTFEDVGLALEAALRRHKNIENGKDKIEVAGINPKFIENQLKR